MLVCHRDKWVFVGLPKTGSRAVRDALHQRFGKRIEEVGSIHSIPAPSIATTRGYTYLVSIRHPFSRALSWYFHKRYWADLVARLPESRSEMPADARATYTNLKGQRAGLGPRPTVWCQQSFGECLAMPQILTYVARDLPLTRYRNLLGGCSATFLRQENLERDLQLVHPRFVGLKLGGEIYTHPYVPYPKAEWKRYFTEDPRLQEQLAKLLHPDFHWLKDYYSKDLTDENYTS